MIGTIVIAVTAGGSVAGVLMWAIRQREVNALVRTLGDADRRITDLSADLAEHTAQVETGMREVATPEITVGQIRDVIVDQLEVIERLRTEPQSTMAAKEHWASHAEQITEEAVRLRGLALAFERWHEWVIPLMEQNHDVYMKDGELQSIVRRVVIVSFNASIGVARAGAAGCGFAVVASGVRALVVRSEGLSKSYRNSLHLNDLTIIITFQDTQAGDKVIIVSLSSVEALASQFQHQLHQAGLT